MQIGRKIYYDKFTGQILVITPETEGDVRETTTEEDFQIYKVLNERNPGTVGCIKLEYGQYREEFANATSIRVDTATEQLIFDFTQQYLEQKQQEATLEQRIADLEQAIALIIGGGLGA